MNNRQIVTSCIVVGLITLALLIWTGVQLNNYVANWRQQYISTDAEPANATLRKQAMELRYGVNQAVDVAGAERLLRQAYANGDKLAGFSLAILIAAKPGEAAAEESKQIWHACDPAVRRLEGAGNIEAKFLYCLSSSGYMDQPDAREYVKYNIPICSSSGYIPALSLHGVILEFGQLGETDPDEAMHWFRRATDSGSTMGSSGMGRVYSNPDYSGFDIDKALEYLQRAGDRKENNALLRIGEIYQQGIGVEADAQRAREYFQRAIDLDGQIAMLRLARMCMDGEGAAVDLARARQLLERALDLPWQSEEAETMLSELDGLKAAAQDGP